MTHAIETLITEKCTFSLDSFTTESGATLTDVKTGYETFGKLNDRGDNAILISPHRLAGSHCAGRYQKGTKVFPWRALGYWDAIIGPGKAIDTDKYFVVSLDGLTNSNAKDPSVITTGPASVDPKTGRPYGLTFPVITQGDQVKLQKALVDHLGVKKLKLVAGLSRAAEVVLQWGATHPDMVERLMPINSCGTRISGFHIALDAQAINAIYRDPNWNGGDYYGNKQPSDGVIEAFKTFFLWTMSFAWATDVGDRNWAAEDANPATSVLNGYAVYEALAVGCRQIATTVDANSMIYAYRCSDLFDLSNKVSAIRAPILFIVEGSDMYAPPSLSAEVAAQLSHVPTEIFDLDSGAGHFAGIRHIANASDAIRKFLER